MMKTLQLAVLAALVILAASTYIRPWRRSCPNKGQFFSLCAPPAPDCVPTCENPKAACRAPCRPGCKCPYGNVLDTKNRRCVPKDHCPQVLCSQAPEVGFCKGYFPRYFHNSTSKQCEKFIYGGCGGNANKFRTLSQCQQTCNVCPVEGQVYSTCARPCTFTCDNVNELVCITLCTTGCDCPGGRVIDTELNKCVPVEECPTRRSCRLGNGTEIKDGERYQPDPCTFCECDNGNLVCAVVDCAAPPCDDYFVPPGKCCPVCPPTLPPKCAAVLCPFVNCSGATIPEGECCAVCPPTLPPKCALVLCLAVDCPGATIPEGECCPVCPKNKVCEYNGQTYLPGDSFPATDGCNTCTCSENGLVACTERACLPKLVCPKPTGFGICAELCPVGADCGPGKKCCSNGCGHVCMTATNCALVDCAPTSCNFPGGVVVPAGEDECCPTCRCRFGNETYSVGDSFHAGDGCNRCSCTSRGVRCTLIACKIRDLEY